MTKKPIQTWAIAVAALCLLLTANASAQTVKAFRSLDFGDSAMTICEKIAHDGTFTPNSKQTCGSTQMEITPFSGPPWGPFKPDGLTSLRPFYTVTLLKHTLTADFNFVDDQLYEVGLRTWPNLNDTLVARSLFKDYVAILNTALGATPTHKINANADTAERENYSWFGPDKVAVARLNYFEHDYWIDIVITDRALGELANQRTKDAAKQAATNEQKQQQEKARQHEQELQNAAKNF